MSTGLERILDKIRENPEDVIMRDRFLSLVSELSSDDEKINLLLSLAAVYLEDDPKEALRISHMAFQIDPEHILVLGMIARCFEQTGSHSKAEIIRRTILQMGGEEAPLPIEKEAEGSSGFDAETIITSNEIPDWSADRALFPSSPPPKQSLADPFSGFPGDDLPPAPQFLEGESSDEKSIWDCDTALSVSGSEIPQAPIERSFSVKSESDSDAQQSEEQYFHSNVSYRESFRFTDSDASSATFEDDNRTTLEEVHSKFAPFYKPSDPQDVSRAKTNPRGQAKLDPVQQRPAAVTIPMPTPEAVSLSMDREQFNVGIYAAIAKLSVRFKPKSAQKDYEGIQNTEFSDAFLLELRETLLADYDLQFSWELVQALWGWGPCQQTVAFLESMGIQRSGEGFWGFYLDGLIGAGWARRALFEIYSLCHEKRELSWARVAYGRLPEVWRLLKLRGFVWKDSDGVDSLCRRLSMRPSRRLEGVLLSGE